jgi:hypothetical protein
MKKIVYIFIVILVFTSCEETIDLELPTSEPKLVIDASINWLKGTPGNEQEIKLSLSAPYFDTEIPAASGAQVLITDSNNNIFEFNEDGGTGIYSNNNFVPSIEESYNLTIDYQGETYSATETFKSVSDLEYIEQNDNGGFSGNETEIKAFYTDPENEENYYLFEFRTDLAVIPSFEVYKDEFVNGNQIFGFYSDEDLKPGDSVSIRNYGVSRRFYEFMFILLQQNSEEGGGPFETQPATVRGNCINQTNPENYPLGYFRLSEVDEIIYTIQ